MPDALEEVQPTDPIEEVEVQPTVLQEEADAEEVHPLTVLHEVTEAAQKTYTDTLTTAKQVRDEAIVSAQKQYEHDLKAYNAAVEAASKR